MEKTCQVADLVSASCLLPTGGVFAKRSFDISFGYLSPIVCSRAHWLPIVSISSCDRLICRACIFSSKNCNCLVPGIGMISSPLAINHASTKADSGHPFLLAICIRQFFSCKLALKFSSANRGAIFRQSLLSKSSGGFDRLVNMPRPRGLYATTATPSSRHVCSNEVLGDSISSVNGEYSIWTAAIWWTLHARRRVSEETSERPKNLTFPSLVFCQSWHGKKLTAVQQL